MLRYDDLDDAELLRRTAREPDAFATFYRRHVRLVLAYARRRTGGADLALDVTAEVFAAALEQSARFRSDRDSAASWLYTIARNKLVDSARRGTVEDGARRRLRMQPIELTDGGLARLESESGPDVLEELLDGLPRSQRDAVRARVLDDCDYDEVAARLRCSNQVARKRVSRGLAALRAQLEGDS